MKTTNELKITGANAALVLGLILSVTLGCGLFGKKQEQVQDLQKIQKFKEMRTTGTITSANTGGSCMKKINGAMKSFPQVGFSYSIDGANYEDTGCAYDSALSVGAKVDVCYTTTTPPKAEICSTPSSNSKVGSDTTGSTGSTNPTNPVPLNKGSGTLASDIVGNWINPYGAVYAFTAEGGFASATAKKVSQSGTYRVVDGQKVIITIMVPGKNVSQDNEVKISINGNKMTMTTSEGESETYTKLK